MSLLSIYLIFWGRYLPKAQVKPYQFQTIRPNWPYK